MTNLPVPTNATCVLCSRQCWLDGTIQSSIQHYHCELCGDFVITRMAILNDLQYLNSDEKAKLSICTRERLIRGKPQIQFYAEESKTDKPLGVTTISEVLNTLFPSRIEDRFDRALMNLCAMSLLPGERLHLNTDTDPPVLFAETKDVGWFMFRELQELQYIAGDATTSSWSIVVTGRGFARQQELEESPTRLESKQAFVAMWFDAETESAYRDGIAPAIKGCGFVPLRIDAKETNNKICDEIEAEIRRSRFLVADFTGQRGGVYYEAGLARGLGLEVISSCRHGEEKNLHFDTRQYKHIVWATPEDLRNQLVNRIGATIPGAKIPKRQA